MKKIPEPRIKYYSEEIYAPSDDSFLIMDYFWNHISDHYLDEISFEDISYILDMGTGTGIIAIFFRLLSKKFPKFSAKIFASDILKNAIDCAKKNAELNNVRKEINFFISDLFQNIPKNLIKKLDFIIFNPPYLPSSSLIDGNNFKINDYVWNGGYNGTELTEKFFIQLKNLTNPEKTVYIYFITSSRANLKGFYEKIANLGFKNEIIDKRHIFFEDILLNKAKLS